jgi:inner membrane protease ATP23
MAEPICASDSGAPTSNSGNKKLSCKECEEALRSVLQRSRPAVLASEIRSSGTERCGRISFRCEQCPSTGAAGGARAYFEAPPAGIALCANRLGSSDAIEEVLVHELVHAYDHCVTGVDLTNSHELAHSEVRAAREAECHYGKPYLWKHCIRTTAISSTRCLFGDETARRSVDHAMDAAMQDRAPLQTPPGGLLERLKELLK